MNPFFKTFLANPRSGLVALLVFFFSFDSAAQTLSGTYTIGTGGNYPTLATAVVDVTAKGVSGPVIFKLKTGTYSEQVTIGAIGGVSATNTITFESESGNAADVTLSFSPTSTDNYIVRLDNASYITFRNVSLETSGTTYTRAIHGINNLTGITFEGLTITLPSSTSASENNGAIILRPSLSSDVRFINNTLRGGSFGILHIGNSSARSPGTLFTGNAITDVYYRPAWFEYMQGLVFNDNVITHSGTAYSDYYGAGIQFTSGYIEMLRNRITGSVGHALRLAYCTGTQAQPSQIANNFFHSRSGYGTVYIYYSLSYTNFYHNSVHNTSTGEAFYFNRGQSDDNRIVNNIFKANSGYAIDFQTSSDANSILESDYNNLFTSGSFIARDGSTTYGSLSAWKVATGLETNSVSFDPQFQSDTELYASGPGIASAGKDLSSIVATDIDGVARTTTPSLGAAQFSAAALTPLSGTYTIGTGSFDFTSIGAAIDAMKTNGISGPVTFQLNSETFAERFMLPFVSGMSSSNPIVFESQSGNPADVVLSPAAATDVAGNYIARLSNAAYVTFRNMTFEPATGTNFNRAILVENRADDLTFENLRITLPSTTAVSEERGAIIAKTTLSSNIRFIDNTITGGAYGILFTGNTTARSPGTVVTGNTITDVYYRPAYFEYLQGMVLNDNTITHSGASYSDYYGLGIQYTSGYIEMLRNRITGAVGHALRLAYCTGDDLQPSLIANNFFHSRSSYSTVYIYYSLSYARFYHNSVHNTSTGEAFYFNRGQSDGNRIVNNIFRAASGYALEFQTSSDANSILQSDYNNLFTSGSFVARDGSTNYGTLSSWKTATSLETNSVSFDPQFQSDTELYATSPGIAAAGADLFTVINTDIDGVARTTTPSMGATQFTATVTPLSGTYTIGTGAFDFASINDAIDAMKANGIDGPVTFQLNSETFAERFVLPFVSGMSSSNPIVFESQSGNAVDVILSPPAATDAASNYIARLSNASYVTFRNLTFLPAAGTNFNRAILVENRADDLTFENLQITLPATTSPTEDRGAIIARVTLSSNIRFINNTITGGAYGVLHIGANGQRSPGTIFTGNTITGVYYRPAYFEYMEGLVFNDNTVTYTGTAYSDYYGLGIQYTSGYIEMLRNRITGTVGHALRLAYCTGVEVQPSLIANNFFHSNSSYSTVYVYYSLSHTNFYHNSVNNTSTGEAFYFNRGQSDGNRIVNNIFRATGGYAIEFQTSSDANSILESDHNNLFTSGAFIGRDGSTNHGTLAAWQSATGLEGNSVSFEPQFQSDTELYASSPGIASVGKDLLSVVPTDIDGVARTATPSPGATQFTATLTPLSGTYTIGTGSFDFPNITAAIDAMKANGISGPVTFRLNSETFAERFVLPFVSGMSSSHPVVFESQSGNAADVVLTPPAATDAGSNYIARLSNVAFVTFRSMTFQPATGTNFNRAIVVENRADDLTFENLNITLPSTTSPTEDRGAIIARTTLSSNIRFIGNTITGGAYGILLMGTNTARSPGMIVTGNTITDVYYRPAFFEYLQGLTFNDNTIAHPGTAYSDYYGMGIQNTSGYIEMLRNRITGTVGHALRLAYCTGIEAQPSLIANNFFHSNSSYSTVYVYYSLSYTNFYHNSVNNTSTGEAFYFNRGQSIGNRIVNNIFRANTGYAMEFQTSSTAGSIAESDYNNLYTSGSFIGRDGSTTYGTLSAWQTASGFEASSVSIDPQFQSSTALYTAVSALSSAGKNVNAEVPDDIDGTARPSAPSLGAAQFGASGTPLNGEYTIDAAGSGATNFTTFAAALDALKNFGINGPVVFRITGEFNEQLTFLAVSGSSETNTVTFESASGQPADAVIRYSSASAGANFTIRLSNADHHRFRNLTIKAENAVYARAVHMINRTVNILMEGNVIESVVTTETSLDRGGILIASAQSQNVHLLNNTLNNGSYGIHFTGPSTKGTGTIIRGNIIDKAYYRGIYLTWQSGFLIDKNQILNNPSSTAFTGIDIYGAEGAFQITANKVTGGNGTALYISSALASAGTPALIANNFLQTNNTSGYRTVYLNYLRNVNVYHNNINATGTGEGLYYASASGQNINLVNNIIRAAGVPVYIYDPVAIGQIDYNDYYTPGNTVGNWGATSAADLAAWQALTAQDANSLSVDPQYQSDTDLEALASSLAGAGLDLTAIVPEDINGNIRALPVSIGASQFSAAFSIDGTVSRLVTPASTCSLTAMEEVKVEITNLGASPISGFQIAYQLDAQTPVVENLPVGVTITPGAKYQYTFAQKADLSAKASYTLQAYVTLAGDENTANDVLTSEITHYPDLVTTLSPDVAICQGEPVTLTATGGVQYLWSTGANSASVTVSPDVTTLYSVQITNANNCSETREVTVTVRESPVINVTGEVGYTTSYMSPLQGASDTPFDFRMIYTDANGHLPSSGYPRIELDANGNGQPGDPFDIITAMQEHDPADADVTDGKEYRVSISGLADNISWRSRVVAVNSDGCATQTPFVSRPLVSNDLLDVGIYANDISFSKTNPAIDEPIKIYARVRNTSDYIAENFVVKAYIEEQEVFSQTILQLNPQSSVTLQWDQSFPTAGFYPVKVVVDETDVLAEDNELNNFAIRPILTGDYQLPGGINVDVTADPMSLQPGQTITITGTAQYFGIDPDVNPDVAGATAIARLTGGGQAQTTTLPDGTFVIRLIAPYTPGTYPLNVEVTDYTLTGYGGPIDITVLPAPPRPDLTATLSLNKTTIITGEQISGMVVLQNVGDAVASNFLFRYFNCDAVLGEEQIASLAPGESLTYTFTTTTGVIGDCFNNLNCQFRAVADVNNEVVEKNEINNQSVAYLTVLPDKPDLTPQNPTNSVIPGYVNMLSPFTFTVRVDNIGGVNTASAFTVNVYVDDVLIRQEDVPLLNSCNGHSFTVTHDFGGDIDDKVLTIKVDEPIGTGIVDEYRETNNEFTRIIRHVPPPAQYPNLSVSARDITVVPSLPAAGSAFDINVVYRNNGQAAITGPFNIEMTVTESGAPRIETQSINETILPGGTRTVTLTTSLATDGDHSFRVKLDADNSIAEGSEGDNIALRPLCVDFTVTAVGSVWGGFYANTIQDLTARIYNNGGFTANAVSVSFYLDGEKIASTVVPVVAPSLDVGFYDVAIPHLFDQAGVFELKAVVDDPAGYTECNETNNEYKANITVRAPAPDVRVFSEYISPSKINPDLNEPITIFLSYDNMGIADSGPFKARVLIDDVPLGVDVDIPSVAAGDDGTVEIPTPYSSSLAGIRVIRAILDPDAQVPESNRLNNEATRALVVGQAPNLFFTNLQTDVSCPDDGASVTITASLENSGDLEATAEVLFFYITESDTIPIDSKSFVLAGNASTTVQTEWIVINKLYSLYAEVRNSEPQEYDESDNFISTKLCGGPYYNLLVSAEGQGLIRKTPDMSRYEGAQQVTITATPATGWVFAGWSGDAAGTTNPLTLNLTTDQAITAIFSEPLAAPSVIPDGRCGPGALTLQASGAIGAQYYVWYTDPTGGTPIPNENGATFTTPDLTTTTSYYVAVASFGGEGPRSEVQASIFTAPSQPVITVNGVLNCPDPNSPTTLQAPAGFSSYLWSDGQTTQQIDVAAAGTYSVQVTDANGCVSAASADVVVTEINCILPGAPTVTGDARCGPGTLTLQASGASTGENYIWYTEPTGGNPIPGETSATYTTPSLTATTSYFVAISSAAGEGPRTEVVATILPEPAQPEVTVQGELNCPDENNPTILQAPPGFAGYIWSDAQTTAQVEVVAAGTYAVQVVDENGCISVASAEVVITEIGCHEVVVYNAISPGNGDNLNEQLIIANVDRLADARENKLRIFNRWGDVVFEADNYDNVNNTFRGLSNSGKELPSGTYFYILEFKSGRKEISGYIALRR